MEQTMSKDNLKYCWEEYYYIGLQELNSSKCLFEHDFYPQALFHLQQSVEKLVKTVFFMTIWGLYSSNFSLFKKALEDCNILRKSQIGKLTLENFCIELPRMFGHNPTKKYLEFLVCVATKYYEQGPQVVSDNKKEKVDNMIKDLREFLGKPGKVIRGFTPTLVLEKVAEIEHIKMDPDEMRSYLDEHIDSISSENDRIPSETFKYFYKEFLPLFIGWFNAFLDIFEIVWLGILFEADNVHSWTRYPTESMTPLELTEEKMKEFKFLELLDTVGRLYTLPEQILQMKTSFEEKKPLFKKFFKQLVQTQEKRI
ncbi:HEPN domain-containing protein [Thermococcus barophilus]|nr:HEPN domain-containing protein [Thermococcus barophilus]